MAIHHRKQLPEKDSNRKPFFSDCCPTCTPCNCGCIPIHWKPEPPQLPPSSNTNNDTATTYISPYLIIILALIATSVFLITYYFIIIRFCSRFRQLSATQANDHSPDVLNQDHQSEIDNPIWYITTVGLQPPVINSITVVKFRKGDSLINYTNCSVCLNEFKDNESLRLLPKCNHAFHIPCIDTWLRSHTNCPLCRAAVLVNNSNMISRSNYQNRNHGFGLGQNSQMENGDNHGELSLSYGQEGERHEYRGELGNVVEVEDESKEIEDSKQEIETLVTLRRSFPMDSATEIDFTDSNSTNSTIEMQSLSRLRDSRT